MNSCKYVFIIVLLGLIISCAPKQTKPVPPISSKEILKTTTSWDGDKIIYPEGDPEITGIIIELQQDVDTGFHCHPVPNLAYMLEGEIEVEVFEGPKIIFKKGDAFEEVIDTWHKGKVLKGPAKILVYYVGKIDTPITIKPKTDDLESLKCIE